jgi:hypothetical protein
MPTAACFEMADTFIPSRQPEELPRERLRLGLVIEGDFRLLRGVIEGLVHRLCLIHPLYSNPLI